MKKTILATLLAPLFAFASWALAVWGEFGPHETYPARVAAFDGRNFQYRVVRFNAAGQFNVASNDASFAATECPRGILQNNPNSGQAGGIAFLGLSKAVAGASITADSHVTTNGSGKVVAAGSGDIVIGVALEAAGAENDVISVQLFPPVRSASLV